MSAPKEKEIKRVCRIIEDVLIEKNRKYGDSALNPVGIFSELSPEEGIRARLDDKLSRIRSQQGDDSEDTELDLIGYLVLLWIAREERLAAQKESDYPRFGERPVDEI